MSVIMPFVTTYNPRDYNIFHFMKQIEFNLNSSERMKNVLQKKNIINSKWQPKNLKGFLSSSKFDFHESSPSVKKCTDKRCMTQTELYYFDLRLHVLVPAVPYVSVPFPTLSVYHVQLFPPDIVDFSNTI
jgi:hypothetical protein